MFQFLRIGLAPFSPKINMTEKAMSIDALKDRIPDYAKDLRLNLGSLASDISLTPQQLGGTFVASALAARNDAVTREIVAQFRDVLSEQALAAAQSANAIMGMNNIYYRFVHMAGGEYAKMPAQLRMSVIGNPGVDKADFELWCLAVSIINGCDLCVTSHEKIVRDALGAGAVQTAARIAATVHAVAVTLQGADALQQ
ncbi:alkyl hydroperoxide reductase AhpD [Acetobacter syzygii]|nr:peroxiredoxin reductase AhpD [Acetobacter syzygii]GBR65235.1 peroxiredoxin reductase [Acetobacter syzygii NRIC 0483]GEL56489.1 alkyl hydroperoxide reductase AhpD [Acetobacter syzygii]